MTSRVNLIPNPNYRKSGTKSYLHLMRKYRFHPTKESRYFFRSVIQQTGRVYTDQPIGGGVSFHQIMQKRLDDGRIGYVEAEEIQNDPMCVSPVSIGTPGKIFMLDFDTGSADLWVWSTELPDSILSANTNHAVFDPSKSSTFDPMSLSSWQIRYADGSSASGSVGTDVLKMGGITIQNQAIELANDLSQSFLHFSGDGLLGLAFGRLNTVRPIPAQMPIQNMIEEDLIEKRPFTAKLSSYRDPYEESFYTFGFIDQPTVQATGREIYYTRVYNLMGLWMVDSGTASVNGEVIDRFWNTAVVDTGTTLALLDDHVCQAIYNAIPGAVHDSDVGGYIFSGDTPVDERPEVGLAVGEKMFRVHKEALAFAEAKPGFVFGGIQSRGTLGFDILGDTFLKAIYAIFDGGHTRFGAMQREYGGHWLMAVVQVLMALIIRLRYWFL